MVCKLMKQVAVTAAAGVLSSIDAPVPQSQIKLKSAKGKKQKQKKNARIKKIRQRQAQGVREQRAAAKQKEQAQQAQLASQEEKRDTNVKTGPRTSTLGKISTAQTQSMLLNLGLVGQKQRPQGSQTLQVPVGLSEKFGGALDREYRNKYDRDRGHYWNDELYDTMKASYFEKMREQQINSFNKEQNTIEGCECASLMDYVYEYCSKQFKNLYKPSYGYSSQEQQYSQMMSVHRVCKKQKPMQQKQCQSTQVQCPIKLQQREERERQLAPFLAKDQLRQNGDYYGWFGVERDQSESEIKRQFRKLALVYHPDKTIYDGKTRQQDLDYTKLYKDLVNMKDIFLDPELRKVHDTYGQDRQLECMGTKFSEFRNWRCSDFSG